MHIKIRKSAKKAKSKDLASQVETIQLNETISSFFDVEDQDVLTYVDNLLRSCKQIGPMEPFSLMSREEALDALAMLEQKQRMIDSHLRTARALKTLLNSKQEGEGQPQ